MSWNIRGVNDSFKRRRIGEVFSSNRPDWVGLQKTKLRDVNALIIAQIFGV